MINKELRKIIIKSNTMKTSLRISALFVLFTLLFSFSNTSENWTLYKTFDGIKVYTKVIDCNAYNATQSYLIFKYENTNSTQKTIKWKLNMWVGERCRSCDLTSPNEYEFNLTLKANETKEGSCNYENDKRFRLYKSTKDNKLVPMTKFEFVNVVVL